MIKTNLNTNEVVLKGDTLKMKSITEARSKKGCVISNWTFHGKQKTWDLVKRTRIVLTEKTYQEYFR
jgi:hypothetical protein